MTVYNFEVKQTDGTEKSLADYQGKVLLIVNTATGCGFTPQYEGLQDLYDHYKDSGFEILDLLYNGASFSPFTSIFPNVSNVV
jgi:glutathione peroxidase